jgi:L-arabinose isomerase
MQIDRRKPLTARVGIVAVGHATYWPQFSGLLEELMGYVEEFEQRVEQFGVDTHNFGMVDDAQSARAALRRMQAADLDLLFVDMVTYATSATWACIIRALDVPTVMVALQPLSGLDYDTATTYTQLANDNICAVPEFASIALRMGKAVPPIIIGRLREESSAAWEEVRDWCSVAHVLHDLRGGRIGQMGHVLEGMMDMHTDPAALTAEFGLHLVQCEPDQIRAEWREVADQELQRMRGRILDFFDRPDPKSDPLTSRLADEDLDTAARVAVALERFVDKLELDGLAYYYEAEPHSEMRRVVSNLIVGNSLLCAAGFPMCGELDLKTCIAMLVMDRLQMGGSFAEFHPVDFREGFVLVGHDGPHHLNIAEGRPVLRSLSAYHGKPGSGASVEFQIKEGPITMLGIAPDADGRHRFLIAEGQSVHGPIPATGNTNTRGYFGDDTVAFLKAWFGQGPTHHFALGIGHRADSLQRVATALGLQAVVVTGDRTPSS